MLKSIKHTYFWCFQNESILDKSQIIIANKYAERFCSAKADHFFEGLDNEKTLKYSYFQYIGLISDEIVLKDMYKPLINQIREKCLISNDEEILTNHLVIGSNSISKIQITNIVFLLSLCLLNCYTSSVYMIF